MVHCGRLQRPPSRLTKSQTLHAETRIISYSTEKIDVTRVTHTTLDVMQECRIDDYWNVDSLRDLSDSWIGFTQFTFFEREASRRIHVVQGEVDETANNIKA